MKRVASLVLVGVMALAIAVSAMAEVSPVQDLSRYLTAGRVSYVFMDGDDEVTVALLSDGTASVTTRHADGTTETEGDAQAVPPVPEDARVHIAIEYELMAGFFQASDLVADDGTASVVYAMPDVFRGAFDGDTGTVTSNTGQAIGSYVIDSGGNVEITFDEPTVTAGASSSIKGSFSASFESNAVTDGDYVVSFGGTGVGSVALTVSQTPDGTVAKSSPASASTGDHVPYVVTVSTSKGTARSVELSDSLSGPGAYDQGSFSVTKTCTDGTAEAVTGYGLTVSGGSFTMELAALTAGESYTVSYTVEAIGSGELSNAVSLSVGDEPLDSAAAIVEVSDVSVGKTVVRNSDGTYTWTVAYDLSHLEGCGGLMLCDEHNLGTFPEGVAATLERPDGTVDTGVAEALRSGGIMLGDSCEPGVYTLTYTTDDAQVANSQGTQDRAYVVDRRLSEVVADTGAVYAGSSSYSGVSKRSVGYTRLSDTKAEMAWELNVDTSKGAVEPTWYLCDKAMGDQVFTATQAGAFVSAVTARLSQHVAASSIDWSFDGGATWGTGAAPGDVTEVWIRCTDELPRGVTFTVAYSTTLTLSGATASATAQNRSVLVDGRDTSKLSDSTNWTRADRIVSSVLSKWGVYDKNHKYEGSNTLDWGTDAASYHVATDAGGTSYYTLQWTVDVAMSQLDLTGGGDVELVESLPQGTLPYQMSASQQYVYYDVDWVQGFSFDGSLGTSVSEQLRAFLQNTYTGSEDVRGLGTEAAPSLQYDKHKNLVTTWYDARTNEVHMLIDNAFGQKMASSSKNFTVKVVAIVTDEVDWDYSATAQEPFANEVALYVGGDEVDSKVQTQTVTRNTTGASMLSKSAANELADGFANGVVTYQLVVNQAGVIYGEAGTLHVHDVMSYSYDTAEPFSAYLVQGSVRVYEGHVGPDGVVTKVRCIDETGATADGHPYAYLYDSQETEGGSYTLVEHSLDLDVPDGLCLVVEYSYKFERSVTDGDVEVKNTATLSAPSSSSESRELKTRFRVSQSGATAVVQGLTVTKVDAENNALALEGARFTLYMWDDDADDWVWKRDFETDSSGQFQATISYTENDDGTVTPNLEGLQFNRAYKMVETAAPTGYVTDPEPVYFYVTHSDTATWPHIMPGGFADADGYCAERVATGGMFYVSNARMEVQEERDVVLRKVDSVERGLGLPGARFSLTSVATGEAVEAVTADDGFLTFTGVALGDYLLEEVAAPDGYEMADGTWTVTVSADGVSVTANGPEKGAFAYVDGGAVTVADVALPVAPKWSLKKVSSSLGGDPLEGALFEVRSAAQDNAVVAFGSTGENGVLSVGELPQGSYTVTELEAPEGYLGEGSSWILTVLSDGTASVEAADTTACAYAEVHGSQVVVTDVPKVSLPTTGGLLATYAAAAAGSLAVGLWLRRERPSGR